MRAFVAIDLPEPVTKALSDLQDMLPAGRPVSAGNLHLTLAFLGEQPEDLIEEAHLGLERLRAPAFDLSLAGVDIFGSPEPGVLFVAALENEALASLQRRVMAVMHGAGLKLSRKRFRPHVTLARFRRGMPPHDLERLRHFLSGHADFGLDPFPVTSFALYRSTLRPDGAVHDLLAEYPLG